MKSNVVWLVHCPLLVLRLIQHSKEETGCSAHSPRLISRHCSGGGGALNILALSGAKLALTT